MLGQGKVPGRRLGFARQLLFGQRLDDLGRRSHGKHPGWDIEFFSDKAHGRDPGIFSNDRPVHDNTVDSHKRIFRDVATVQYSAVPDVAKSFNHGEIAGRAMNDTTVLNRVSYAIRGLAADVRGVAVADTALLRGEVASAGPWYNRRICKESSHDLPIDRPATSQA